MIINHNLPGANAISRMNTNSAAASNSMQKLSSGLRINKAGDDAAGLAISEKMRGQIRGLDQASANAQDGISMIQTAEGALSETHSILQRMRELAVQSSNDTNVAVDRSEIQKEMDELAKEVTRISNNTEFNTQKLINGGIKDDGIKSAKFHVGANANQDITLSINAMDAKSLGVSRDVTTATGVGAGKVSAATFSSDLGTGIVDGANVSITYTAGSIGTAAAAAVKTGDAALGSSVGFDTATKIKIGGTDVTLTNVKALGATYDAATNIDTVVSALQNDIDATALNGDYTVGKSGTKLTITSAATGLAAKVDLTGSDAATGATLLGFTTLTAVNGTDAVPPTSAKVTLTSDGAGTPTQDIDVTGTETSINVTSGNFKGMKLTFSGAASTLATSGTADKVTLDVSTTAASAATFASGEKTADAVTEAGIDVSTQSAASSSITTIQTAIETVSAERSKLGAYQNRLEHTIANLGTSSENLTSAESRIRDVDMAKEMSTFSKNNILAQAAQAMLAQANTQPQQVLQLLR